MNYNKIARDYYSLRYFCTIEEYFNDNNITDTDTKKHIKLELLEIEKEELQKELLLDTLLKSCKAFKFSQKDNKNNFLIYHHCTKEKGFQISFFYKNMPISDIIRSTITDIKKELKMYINSYDVLEECIGKLA